MKIALCTSSSATTNTTNPIPTRQYRVFHQRARRSRPAVVIGASRTQRTRKLLGKCGDRRDAARHCVEREFGRLLALTGRWPAHTGSRRWRLACPFDGTPRAVKTRCMPKQKPPSRDVRSSRPTVGGPAESGKPASTDVLAEKVAATGDLAAAFPFNANKASEYDPAAAVAPPAGAFVKPQDPIVGASTVSEANGSDKAGSGGAPIGDNPTGRARSIASASIRPTARSRPTRACRSPTTRPRSRPACAGRRCSRTSSSARRSPTSITSGSPSASSTPAARRRTATSSATSR